MARVEKEDRKVPLGLDGKSGSGGCPFHPFHCQSQCSGQRGFPSRSSEAMILPMEST